MFTWLGMRLDSLLNGQVLSVVTGLSHQLRPLAAALLTLWFSLHGYLVLQGLVHETATRLAWKCMQVSAIVGLALQSGVYMQVVCDNANALDLAIAQSFAMATPHHVAVDPSGMANSPYAIIDGFNEAASQQVGDIMRQASPWRLDLLLAAGLFTLGSVTFLCAAMAMVTLSKVSLTFVLALGPLFILSLLWPVTNRLFHNWLGMLVHAAVLNGYAFFALGMSTSMGQAICLAIQAGGGFVSGPFNVLGEAMRYCVVMLLMALVCWQAPRLAGALTASSGISPAPVALMAWTAWRQQRLASGAKVSHSATPVASPHALPQATPAAPGGGVWRRAVLQRLSRP